LRSSWHPWRWRSRFAPCSTPTVARSGTPLAITPVGLGLGAASLALAALRCSDDALLPALLVSWGVTLPGWL
jgi:hypothetical protein